MFKVLLYLDNYEKLVDTVTHMKKLGIDVDSHQHPLQVVSQAIDFNTDFVILQAYPDSEAMYNLAGKLNHLAKAPSVILLKKEGQKIDSAQVMKNKINRVFSESFEIYDLLSYLLETRGFNPQEVLNKYLRDEGGASQAKKPKSVSLLGEKFKSRDYKDSLKGFDPGDCEPAFDSQKVGKFKKELSQQKQSSEKTARDQFLEALLKNQAG